MKLFIFACLVAAAVAAPDATADAEADPALLYGGAYYRPYAAYSGYGYAASPYAYRSAYSPYYAGYRYGGYGYHALGKRSADAEAEADPALYYSTAGYHYAPYTAAYRSYAAAPVVAAPVAYAAHPATVSPSYGGYAPYANYGRYFAKSGPVVHVAKRDAEAEPTADADAEADPYLLYGNRFYSGYAGYAPYARSYYSGYSGYYPTRAYSGYPYAYRTGYYY